MQNSLKRVQDNAKTFYIQYKKSLCLFRSVQFLFKSFQGNLKEVIGNSSFPRAIKNRQRQLNRLNNWRSIHAYQIKSNTGLSEGISERFRPIQSLKYEFKDAQGSIIKDI